MTHSKKSISSERFAQRSEDEVAETIKAAEDSSALSAPPATRRRRIWALALGTAALWQLDPAFIELADMVAFIACANNKTLAKDAILKMRSQAESLRATIAPLPASALSKVVRRAEAACGAVLDKGVRVREVQSSWDMFETCVKAPHERST